MTRKTDAALKEFKARFKNLVKEAAKAGLKIQPSTPATAVLPEQMIQGDHPALKRLKPGPKRGHLRLFWELEDFGPKKNWVTFVPQEIPEMRQPLSWIENPDGSITHWQRLTVNGCAIWLQLFVPNTVPAAFYHTYENQRQEAINLRRLKRTGSTGEYEKMWEKGGANGQNTWFYMPEAPTAWFDIDGRYMSPDRTYLMFKGVPIPLDEFTLIRGGRVELTHKEAAYADIKTRPTQSLSGMTYPADEPEPAWRKTNPWKKEEKNGHKEESQRGIEHRSEVPIPSGSDEQPNSGNRGRNSKSRGVSKGSNESSSRHSA